MDGCQRPERKNDIENVQTTDLRICGETQSVESLPKPLVFNLTVPQVQSNESVLSESYDPDLLYEGKMAQFILFHRFYCYSFDLGGRAGEGTV